MKKKSPRKPIIKNCDFCNSQFEAKKNWQRFCCTEYHDKYWIMKHGESRDKFKNIEKRLDGHEQRISDVEKAISISLNPKTPKGSPNPQKEARKGSNILIRGCISNGGDNSVSPTKKLKGGKRKNDCQS